MKKLLLVLAIGTFAVACNNSGGSSESKDTATVAPAPDTTATTPMDTTTHADSTAKKADTTAAH